MRFDEPEIVWGHGEPFGSRRRRGCPQASALFLLLTACLLSACSHGSGHREVWAEVNGHPIYRDDVEIYYRQRLPNPAAAMSDEQILSLKLNLLDEMIDNELLIEQAMKLSIVVSDAEIDHEVASLRSPYSPEEFQKKLAADGLTPTSLREQIRRHLLVEKLLDRDIRSRIVIRPAEVSAYYNAHQSQFAVPETRYHLAQILVTVSRDVSLHNLRQSDAVGRAAAERKVRTIEQQLRAGQDFATLAEEYSEDPATASGGGDMGFVPASSIASQTTLRMAVNAMRVGQLSGIVKDEKSNYHIIKLLGREDAGQRPLSDPGVQKTIHDALAGEREQMLRAAYLEDLRNRAKLKDELASRIVQQAGNPTSLK
jgi:peptidyl-prolyl cis-trans isomerase SurA